MMRLSPAIFGTLALAVATPALADPLPATPPAPAATTDTGSDTGQSAATAPDATAITLDEGGATAPPKAFTVTGGVTLTSDYRFRGLTQSDSKPVPQATLNINHASGLYVGTWISAIDGGADGSTPALTNYGGAEVDLYGGFTKTYNAVGVDVGLLYYFYPGRGAGMKTDFFEPYASINYTIGPVNAKLGGNYAWGGQPGLDFTSGSDDSLYLYGELAASVPGSPITVKGHLGHTDGSLGLANLSAADDTYWDWSLTAEAVIKTHFKVGVSYVDTDITEAKGTYTKGSGDTFKSRYAGFAHFYGRGATVLAYVGVSF